MQTNKEEQRKDGKNTNRVAELKCNHIITLNVNHLFQFEGKIKKSKT